MKEIIKKNKKIIIIVTSIIVLIVGFNVGHTQLYKYKYKTGFGLTSTQKNINIKGEIIRKRYDKALELTNNYYEGNDLIRLQWKEKIEKCKDEGLNIYNVLDLEDIK